jgi:hypothetical protein
MTKTLVAVNTAADTFDDLIIRTNEIINALAQEVVTANTTTNGSLTTGNLYINGIAGVLTLKVGTLAGGNVQSTDTLYVTSNLHVNSTIFTVGNSTVNSVVNSTHITLSNSTVAFSFTKPTVIQYNSGEAFLASDGTWKAASLAYANLVSTGTTAQLVDSWTLADYYAAKYIVTVKDNVANNRLVTEFLILHDEGNAYYTEYASVESNTINMASISANANSTHVRVYITPVSANTDIKTKKVFLEK